MEWQADKEGSICVPSRK